MRQRPSRTRTHQECNTWRSRRTTNCCAFTLVRCHLTATGFSGLHTAAAQFGAFNIHLLSSQWKWCPSVSMQEHWLPAQMSLGLKHTAH
eukprot:897780-Amphidinium_carterae.1